MLGRKVESVLKAQTFPDRCDILIRKQLGNCIPHYCGTEESSDVLDDRFLDRLSRIDLSMIHAGGTIKKVCQCGDSNLEY